MTAYREPGEVLPDKLTEEEWRCKDAHDMFQKYLSHDNVAPRLPTDIRKLLSFAFHCGWNAQESHSRRFISRIEEELIESKYR